MSHTWSHTKDNILEYDDSRSDEQSPEILRTSKGKDLLTYEGFTYFANKRPVDNIHYWECRERSHGNKRKGKKCPARVVSEFHNGRHNITSTSKHNHVNDPLKIMEIIMRKNLKRRARDDSGGPAQLIQETSADFPSHMQNRISTEAQRKLIERTWNVEVTQEKDPETLDEFTVPEELTNTIGFLINV
nr:uncharacterized protein LOC115266955 [Aedes albopictus]